MKTKEIVFIDSNIWIYLAVRDQTQKHQLAINLLQELLKRAKLVVSVQVLNEVYWNLLKKYKFSDHQVKQIVETGIIQICSVTALTLDTYKKACLIRKDYNISFWDSHVIASSLENNCDIFYSEDLQHNQVIENRLRIINPFIG